MDAIKKGTAETGAVEVQNTKYDNNLEGLVAASKTTESGKRSQRCTETTLQNNRASASGLHQPLLGQKTNERGMEKLQGNHRNSKRQQTKMGIMPNDEFAITGANNQYAAEKNTGRWMVCNSD